MTLTIPVAVTTQGPAGRIGPDDLLDQLAIDGDVAPASKILEIRSYAIRRSVLECLHQREEVVQHMPDNFHGTLEVVGR